jgi:hypothetical protein
LELRRLYKGIPLASYPDPQSRDPVNKNCQLGGSAGWLFGDFSLCFQPTTSFLTGGSVIPD